MKEVQIFVKGATRSTCLAIPLASSSISTPPRWFVDIETDGSYHFPTHTLIPK